MGKFEKLLTSLVFLSGVATARVYPRRVNSNRSTADGAAGMTSRERPVVRSAPIVRSKDNLECGEARGYATDQRQY